MIIFLLTCNQIFCTDNEPTTLIERYNEKYELVSELEDLHNQSFIRYIRNLLSNREDFCMEKVLEKAILSLDEDISAEALKTNAARPNLRTISVAMSGAVACVAHIDGSHLHVANVGDCRAVLGVLTEENTWIAKQLTKDHNADNVSEVSRIKNEHPPNEADTVIRNGRLLGQLAPLRALGDVRYSFIFMS
jgi:pyruvate dehydrogenase phosphatase